MCIGDLRYRICCDRFHQLYERRHHTYDRKYRRSDDIEQQMDHCRTFGIRLCSDRSEYGCDTSSDILTKQNIHRTGQRDHPRRGKRLQNTDRCGRRLDDRGKYRADENSKQRVGKACHKVHEHCRIPERLHRTAHHVHSDEQHTESRKNLTDMSRFFILHKHDAGNAEKCDQRRDRSDIKCDQLTGDRCTYVGSHDDPYSLVQCHQSRVYKSDYHDSRCGRRLDHRRDHSSDQNRFDTVGSQFLEDLLHLVAGSRFQTVAHHLHSVQEQRQSAKQ